MKKMIGRLLLCLTWSVLTTVTTSAAEDGVDVMVITATMTEKTLLETPGTVEIVTAQEIAELGALTVAEALQWSTGLVLGAETGRTQVPGIRGTGAKHTLVLIDGRRWSAGYKDLVDINQIPVTLIDRIEILRGPGSALYGSDALGGVINLITRRAAQELQFEVDARYGNTAYADSDQYRGDLLLGGALGKVRTIAAAGYLNKDPFDVDGELPEDGDAIKLNSAAGRIAYDVAPGHELSAGFEYNRMERDGERYYQKAQRERQSEDKRINFFATYKGKLADNGHLYVGAYRSEHKNQIVMVPHIPVTAEEDAEHSLTQYEARYSTMLATHYLTLGGEYRQEERKDVSGSDKDIHNSSVFLQDEFLLAPPLSLVVGARFDEHSEFGSQLSPRVSLLYDLTSNWQVNASYSQGFRAPSLSELFVHSYRRQGKEVYQPNPDLEAEKSKSYELGIRGSCGHLTSSVTYFFNEIDDLIEPLYSHSSGSKKSKIDYYTFQNITEARMYGVELEGQLALQHNLTLSAHLTWLDTENKQTGKELEGQPDYQGMAKLAWQPRNSGFSANIRMRYIGEKQFATGGDSASTTLWYLYASQRLSEQLEIYAGIDNIFNRLSDSDNQYLIDPAFYYGGFRWKF